MLGVNRRKVALLFQTLQPRDHSVYVGLAVHIGVNHPAHFQHLRFGGLVLGGGTDRQRLRGAFRVGPIEHLDAIRKRLKIARPTTRGRQHPAGAD